MLFILQNLSGIAILAAGLALIIVLILSLTLHEFAHAYIAYKNGDLTAKNAGRLTVNPLAHMDPIGMFCCFFCGFGWAKPVPINPNMFRNYKRGMILTSLAGVVTNLILAFFGAGFFFLCMRFITVANFGTIFVTYLFYFMYSINLSLFVFNLLPIYPLDGFKVIEACTKYNNKYVDFMKRYGTLILLVVVLLCGNWVSKLMEWVGYPITAFWNWVIF